ncbi:MAG: pyridoxal 5'-phosphate synthase glutaminase subunit PdxT [Terracidiphilus sp.]
MSDFTRPLIGVLAIQGDYAAHAEALADVGANAIEVRKPEELARIDGLVLPGGESTTVLKFLEKNQFFDDLKQFCNARPVFGTCAGTILLAREVRHPAQRSLGVLDAIVERNAYATRGFPHSGEAGRYSGSHFSSRALRRPASAQGIREGCNRSDSKIKDF